MKVSVATVLGMIVASLIFELIPGIAERFQWQRGEVNASLGFRWMTCHLTHWSPQHFLWDMCAFVILSITAFRLIPEKVLPVIVVAAIAIPLEIWWFQPQFETYRGLSGIDSALFGLIIAALWRHGSRARLAGLVAMALFAGKSLFEWTTGETVFVSNQEGVGFVPAPSAHFVGAVCGLMVGFIDLRGSGKKPGCESVAL